LNAATDGGCMRPTHCRSFYVSADAGGCDSAECRCMRGWQLQELKLLVELCGAELLP
jgi:hypothetical protein